MKLRRLANGIPHCAGFLLSLVLVLATIALPCLMGSAPAKADSGIMRWDTIPTPGSVSASPLSSLPGTYDVLSPGGGEIIDLAVGQSGTAVAIVRVNSPGFDNIPRNIFLISKNNGLTWSDSAYANQVNLGWVERQIVSVAMAPDNPAVWAITVADDDTVGPTHVFYTDQAGVSLVDTGLSLPAGETIRSVDVSVDRGDGVRDIAVATVTGVGNGGGSFYVISSSKWGAWKNQGTQGSMTPVPLGSADYFNIKFSPNYPVDFSVVLVYANANATFCNVGFRDLNLNTTIGYAFASGVEVKNSSSAANASPGLSQLNITGLQLPTDFTGQTATLRRAYVSLDANPKAVGASEDGILRIDDTHVFMLMDTTKTLDKSVYSIAYYGTYAQGKLLTGEHRGYPCTATVPTWFTDSPTTCPIPCWYPALKPTTGAAAQGTCGAGIKNGIGATRVAWNEDGSLAFAGTGSLDQQTGARWWANLYNPPVQNDESAFAVSRNNGETWNQLSLIDTTIDWFNDVAPTPDCSTIYLASVNHNTALAGVCDEFDSVWRTTLNPKVADPLPVGPVPGFYWERVLTHTTSDSCEAAQSDFPLLRVPMGCDDKPDGEIVAWAAEFTKAQMWSPDYGDFWAYVAARDPIIDFAFETSKVLYDLSPSGMVQRLTYSGTEWSSGPKSYDSRTLVAHSIAVIPKGKVLVGAGAGGDNAASYSATGGEQWIEIPRNATIIGNVHVAFDADFTDNKFVYLADDKLDANFIKNADATGTVFREEVPAYIKLEDADMMTPGNQAHAEIDWPASANGIPLTSPPHAVGQFGVVAARTGEPQPAVYSAHDNITTTLGRDNSAVCRTLKPWQPMPKYGVGWDCLDIFTPSNQEDVRFTLEPTSLKYCGCCTLDTYTTLFAIDNEAGGVFNGGTQAPPTAGYTPSIRQGMLWAYTDCLAKKAPLILKPEDGGFIGSDPVTGRNQQVDLSWEQLCVAVRYDLEIYKDRDMTMKVNPRLTNPGGVAIITSVKGSINVDLDNYNVTSPSVWIAPGALPEAGNSYYWRVRVTRSSTGQIAVSPWSPVSSFSIKPGFVVKAPVQGIQLLSPKDGCSDCPIKPAALSWTPYKEATKYEVVLAKDPEFAQIVKRATTTTTSYQYEDALEYGKSYYWRVRSTEVNGKSNVSDWSATFSLKTVAAPAAAPAKAGKQQQSTPGYLWIVIVVIVAVPVAMIALIVMSRRSKY
jgi:hypothetical protein